MEEKKREETTPVSSKGDKEAVDTSSKKESVSTEREEKREEKIQTPFKGVKYLVTFLVVLVIGLGLIFVLERDGRISTGVFSGITENMKANSPAAKVNGVTIPRSEFDSSVNQLVEIAKAQGADVTDPIIIDQFNAQAIDTLINGELLRQEAMKKGMEASSEEIDTRYSEISENLGGEEVLATRMAEFGITKEDLRRDIENEILIQGLFESELADDEAEITDEEVLDFYNLAGGAEAGLPPMEEISEQIKEQIKLDRQQQQIGEYIDQLRTEADIEILV